MENSAKKRAAGMPLNMGNICQKRDDKKRTMTENHKKPAGMGGPVYSSLWSYPGRTGRLRPPVTGTVSGHPLTPGGVYELRKIDGKQQ